MSPDKPLPITKAMVWKAYQLVRRNGKAAGVDGRPRPSSWCKSLGISTPA